MKVKQMDVVGIDPLASKPTGTGGDGTVKQMEKPGGFNQLLKQFRPRHDKLPSAVDTQDQVETSSHTSIKSSLPNNADGADPSVQGAGENEKQKGEVAADLGTPVLWAQLQMSQTGTVEPAISDGGRPAEGEFAAANGLVAAASSQLVAPQPPVAVPMPVPAKPAVSAQNLPTDIPKPEAVTSDATALVTSGHKGHGGHDGAKTPAWIADLANVMAAKSEVVPSTPTDPAESIRQDLAAQSTGSNTFATIVQTAGGDGMLADHKRATTFAKGGFESGQTEASAVGLDVTSQATQTAVSLGVSATIPIDAAPETAIANQVTVWVSQNIQSAELKLDALGSDPVEVSIALVGNQATVAFRCDTAETRDMLNRAAEQLNVMLQAEGLVLSGVTVGTSAQSQAGQQGASDPSSQANSVGRGRSAANIDRSAQTLNLVPRPRVPAGSVDLFV